MAKCPNQRTVVRGFAELLKNLLSVIIICFCPEPSGWSSFFLDSHAFFHTFLKIVFALPILSNYQLRHMIILLIRVQLNKSQIHLPQLKNEKKKKKTPQLNQFLYYLLIQKKKIDAL